MYVHFVNQEKYGVLNIFQNEKSSDFNLQLAKKAIFGFFFNVKQLTLRHILALIH